MELDLLDRKAAEVLDGYLVRKDLVRTFSKQFPVPTYVVEFMLGRYCASTDQEEIDEGLAIVQRQLQSRTVRANEEELFKARAVETGEVKIIDLITARVDNRGEYSATLPSLRLTDVRISSELVNQHERMLTGGFYAELGLAFDLAIAQENRGRPFGITSLRDFLSECWSQLRNQSRVSALQGRVFFGGALSGRDTNAVNKTVSGLLKLLYPGAEAGVPDEDLEWAVRIALEARRLAGTMHQGIG